MHKAGHSCYLKTEVSLEAMQISSTGCTRRNQSLLNARRWISAHILEPCARTKLDKAELPIGQEETSFVSCTNKFHIYKQFRQLRTKLWAGDLDSAYIYLCRYML